jgi:hypothetical protein
VYPHKLVWRNDNPHPALRTVRTFLGSVQPGTGTWIPGWARL